MTSDLLSRNPLFTSPSFQGNSLLNKSIQEGYHSVTPYLSIDGAAQAIEFYKKAFGAQELYRMPAPNDRVGHAEIQIGDSRVMLADEEPSMSSFGPKSVGGTPVRLLIYLEDVDKVF